MQSIGTCRPQQVVLAATLSLWLASPGAAQVSISYTDSDFASGWTQATVVTGSGGGVTATTESSGGNSGTSPDPRRRFNHTVRNELYVWHLSPFAWNPATQGAFLSDVTIGFDYRVLSPIPGAIGYGAALEQAGKYYFYTPGYDPNVFHNASWRTFSQVLSTSSGWCRLAVAPTATCLAETPDFSATAPTLRFGLLTANSGGNYSTAGVFDDYTVSFTAEAPVSVTPEPVSMALLGTGLAGLGAVRRRRRRETAQV